MISSLFKKCLIIVDLKNSKIGETHPYFVKAPKKRSWYLQDGGTVLFSKYPILKEHTVTFNHRSHTRFSSKGFVFARIELPGTKIIDLVNLHFQAYHKYAETRLKQIEQLKAFLDKEHHSQNPLFILGDFNIPGDEKPEYQVLRNQLNLPMDLYRSLRNDEGFTL